MPLSLSKSILSRNCSFISRCGTVPVTWSNLSANVDFPWSIWAMMEKFRIFDTGTLERRSWPSLAGESKLETVSVLATRQKTEELRREKVKRGLDEELKKLVAVIGVRWEWWSNRWVLTDKNRDPPQSSVAIEIVTLLLNQITVSSFHFCHCGAMGPTFTSFWIGLDWIGSIYQFSLTLMALIFTLPFSKMYWVRPDRRGSSRDHPRWIKINYRVELDTTV